MEIKLNDAKCTGLTLSAPVQLAQDADVVTGFEIEAYTGTVVDRWWGKLAIEVDGIKAKKQIPVLMNHNSNQIVGYSTKTHKDGSFFVTGKFSDVTEKGKEVKGLAQEGFPWQASIGVRPVKILSLEKDGKADVNGKTLKGPAEIWLESEVFETSFVPLGADSNTSVATFSKFEEIEAPTGAEHTTHEKEENMEKITMEVLAKDAPELLAKIKGESLKEGAKQERERIQAVLEQSMPGHDELLNKLAFDGKTTGPEAAVQVLAAERQLLAQRGEDFNSDGVDPVSQPAVPEPKPKTVPETEAEFKADKSLVEEFGGDFEAYAAYLKATNTGLVRVLKNKE